MRALTGIFLFAVSLLTPFWFFISCAGVYACVYRPRDIFIMGICADILFGHGVSTFSFLYTVSTGILACGAILVRPYLSVYAKEYDG